MAKSTHTYVILEVTPETWLEIASKLHSAGYGHAFHEDSKYQIVIDMHGIAIAKEPQCESTTVELTPN